MRAKLAACDSCRFAKLACDHVKPVCGRCRKRDNASTCTYRSRPFKKKLLVQRRGQEGIPQYQLPTQDTQEAQEVADVREDEVTNSRSYPNPGYLGSSSHTTIFHKLSPALNHETSDLQSLQNSSLTKKGDSSVDQYQISEGAKLLADILESIRITSCRDLVDQWTSQNQANFALAGSLTRPCTYSTEETLTSLPRLPQAFPNLSKRLFTNSCKPIAVDRYTLSDDFLDNFCRANIRWETIGLFLTAVSRATQDVTEFPPLFCAEPQRNALRKAAMRYAGRCLDLALSLDCLNDLQLILQYEIFINHSFVDGNQSYNSWKRLGDVTSSVLALGYHEKIDANGSCPSFLKHLRRAAVARVYSADKNLAIFLGRPPRLDHKYCTFDFTEHSESHSTASLDHRAKHFGWCPGKPFDYVVDSWWSFECALLKEEIMHLQHEKDSHLKTQNASDLKRRAESRWSSLPTRYQYSGDLSLPLYQPIERDFVAGARLNYLHVLFLLRLTFVRHAPEQDHELLNISAEMLHIAVKAAIMKDQLSFSGTGIIWKICHYGTPATGILCLALLNQPSLTHTIPRAKVIQDLSVLVAHVDTGVLIDSSDPNYPLLSAATRTIQAILNKTLSDDVTAIPMTQSQAEVEFDTLVEDGTSWLPWSNNDGWDFELDFWTNLAEHPVLTTDEMQANRTRM